MRDEELRQLKLVRFDAHLKCGVAGEVQMRDIKTIDLMLTGSNALFKTADVWGWFIGLVYWFDCGH